MDGKPKRALLSWSSGKDSAWALHMLQKKRSDMEVVGLFTTIHEDYQRVTMHAVRLDLVRRQAAAAGLPLRVIEIPDACSDERYQEIMGKFVDEALDEQVQCMAFGDLFLEDVRNYREERLKDTGITPIFPLWEKQTDRLAREMLAGGLRAIVTCVDLEHLPGSFAGREFDLSMLTDLPSSVDPCGENGEFHTCIIDGPMFDYALEVSVGDIVERDGFMFADLVTDE
jgi:uncharacterized protein (TIGR00290 family)